MVDCEHGNSAPIEIIESLPRPCESRAGRQKCAVCSYAAGKEAGLGKKFPGPSEECAQRHAYAPLDMLLALPRTQVEPHRHRCVYLAYQAGKAAGEELAAAQADDAEEQSALEEDAEVARILQDPAIAATQKEQLVLARRGQGAFRRNVRAISAACPLTGIAEERMLIAAHIKPWRACSDAERLDGHNGFLMAPHVDHLFDKGWITFEDDGTLLLAPSLDSGLLEAWGLPTSGCFLELNAEHLPYLDYHRRVVFQS